VKSPDSQLEAVLVKGDGGATTSSVSSICLVPAGSPLDPKDREKSLFDADHLSELDLAWASADLCRFGIGKDEF
jgi:hypothetical protein